jgi:hypothetical protein
MAKSAIFPCLEPGLPTQVTDLEAFMSADVFGAHQQEKCRAPFSGEDFVDVNRRGRVRPDATNLRIFGRHKDAGQRASLPRRAVSLYLDASGYAELRQHNRATH